MSELSAATLLAELVKRPSLSGKEHEVLGYLEQFLNGRGADVWRVGRNLVVTHGQYGPTVWLNSHLDTVQAAAGYTFDPHSGHITADGMVLGLGANDAKGSVAAMTMAFLGFRESHPDFDEGRLRLVLTCDEETGGEGLEWLRDEISEPDAVLIGEPNDLLVANCCKGMVRASVEVLGQAAHASRPWQGKSAIRLALPALQALFADQEFPEDPVLGRATLEVTMISGGHQKNAVPAQVTLVIDGRSTPLVDNEALVARLHQLIDPLPDCTVTVQSSRLEATRTPADGKLVLAALAVRGQAEPAPFMGVCDFVHVGDFDALVCGPGQTERSHQADEFILVEELDSAVTVYQQILERYFFGAS